MSIYLNNGAEKAAVKSLGEDIGFGRIIQLAHQCWDEMLEAKHGIKGHREIWTLASADLIRERRAAPSSETTASPMGAISDQGKDTRDEQTASLLSRLKRDVADLTKALTGLTCGGSEFFNRRGDGFIADIPACLAYIAKVRESQHATMKHALHANQAAQARIKVLEGALETFAILANEETDYLPDEHLISLTYDDSDLDDDLGGPNTLLGERFMRAFRRARAALLPQLGGENG